ncbi:hypothetical protein ACFYVK_35190 [Streptomyces chartreusis]|uniref:hypothetical protein n=1 Tax=Streptomyces chartreusis TaxID=1969 RepID=UPI00369F7AA3
MIQPGQIYAACDGSGYRYRIDAYTPGGQHAHVTDLHTNRPKQVKAANLHDSDRTPSGEPRRTGYALEAQT